MKLQAFAAAMLFVAFSAHSSFAQNTPYTPPVPKTGAQGSTIPPPNPYTPTAAELGAITSKLATLNASIADLKKSGADDDLIVDAESCAWVVNNVVKVPDGFINPEAVPRCMTLLADGQRRADQIKNGTAAWNKMTGRLNRAYRSVVDGTAQPYHLSIPASYDPSKPTPLYVYLHGRSHDDPDLGLTWVGGSDAPSGRAGGGGGGQNYIRVEAFGRANNSYRWAGETDVYEAIASVRKRYNIDPDRIILAGFSLGGAGSWQCGLHHPDMFCGLEIDAGVIGNRVSFDGMTPVQKAAQATYGIMIDHALNVWNVPLVAYAGANDGQLLSSTNIRKQLTKEGFTIDQLSTYVGKGRDINALFLATPNQAHSHATGATQQLIDEFNAANFKRGRVVPDHIRYITYTTRYNTDYWVTIDGLQHQFNRASVDAERNSARTIYTIKTSNVSALRLSGMSGAGVLTIDGQNVEFGAGDELSFVNDKGHWQAGFMSGVRKQHGLQGQINDAFMDAFICVSPSGPAYNAISDEHARQELDRFAKMFKREYLGEARTKADSALTADDIANNNLILFGDPSSNAILAKIADKLPIQWNKDTITVGGKTYSTADHMPVLIYPNPLNSSRYVVINTGLPANNFNQQSGYGDYAILKLAQANGRAVATEVADGGVFNEFWQLPGAN